MKCSLLPYSSEKDDGKGECSISNTVSDFGIFSRLSCVQPKKAWSRMMVTLSGKCISNRLLFLKAILPITSHPSLTSYVVMSGLVWRKWYKVFPSIPYSPPYSSTNVPRFVVLMFILLKSSNSTAKVGQKNIKDKRFHTYSSFVSILFRIFAAKGHVWNTMDYCNPF